MKTEWISIKDRLPETDGRYMVFMNRMLEPGEVRIGDAPFYQSIDIFPYYVTKKYAGHNPPSWEAKIGFKDLTPYITHWMPLPQKP